MELQLMNRKTGEPIGDPIEIDDKLWDDFVTVAIEQTLERSIRQLITTAETQDTK